LNDNCTIPTVTYEFTGATTATGSGDAGVELFNPGETTVTYTVDDGNGNSSQCAFTVTYQEIGEIIVSVAQGSLTVETEGTYQWLNCSDMSVIEGETESTFSPGESGEYAVVVARGGCSDTSQCYSVDVTGLGMNDINQGFRVYPMPAEEFVTIEMTGENTNVLIRVVNVMGQPVLIKTMDKLTKTNLDISKLNEGVYLIQIKSDQLISISPMIKE
jgi:hypothetical protein